MCRTQYVLSLRSFELNLKKMSKPVLCKPRVLTIALKDQVNKKISRQKESDILDKVMVGINIQLNGVHL